MKDDILIHPRQAWGARDIALSFERNRALGIVLHNMQNENRDPAVDHENELKISFKVSRDCQHDQMTREKPFSDIGQNFTISRGGVIMEGRKGSLDAAHQGHVSQGAHASGVNLYNKQYFGIELEGDFAHGFVATEAQKKALYNLCAHLRMWAGNPDDHSWRVVPHAEVLEGHTDCPRKLIEHMEDVRLAIRSRLTDLMKNGATTVPPVDVPVLKSEQFRGNNSLEAVADGHLVLKSSGTRVLAIGPVQDALSLLGFPIDLGTDNKFRGFFGEKTAAALTAFQQATHGILQPTGELNQDTVLALDKALRNHGAPPEPPAVHHEAALLSHGKVIETLKEKPGGSGPLRNVDVLQLTDRPGFYFRAAMAIDVDGSPRAYSAGATSPKALDGLGSADAAGSSTTYIQQRFHNGRVGEGPYKDFYVSGTSLRLSQSEMHKTSNFVDAETVPYVVFPFNPHDPNRFPGLQLGDMAYVVDLKTGRSTHAIFADTNSRVGEASLKVAVNLGRGDLNAGNGEEEDRFVYILFPGTRFDPLPTVPHWPDSMIKTRADLAFAAWGGMEQVRHLYGHA